MLEEAIKELEIELNKLPAPSKSDMKKERTKKTNKSPKKKK